MIQTKSWSLNFGIPDFLVKVIGIAMFPSIVKVSPFISRKLHPLAQSRDFKKYFFNLFAITMEVPLRSRLNSSCMSSK